MASAYQKLQEKNQNVIYKPDYNYVIGEAYHPVESQLNPTPKLQSNYPLDITQNENKKTAQTNQFGNNQSQYIYPQLYMPNQVNTPLPIASNLNQPQFITIPRPQNFIVQNQPKTRFTEQLYCVTCKRFIASQIIYRPGLGAVIVGGIIAFFGGWLGCCLIPCVLKDCKDAIHTCPECGIEIGSRAFLTN